MLRPFAPSWRAGWTCRGFWLDFFSRATAACVLIGAADLSVIFLVPSAGAAQLNGVVQTGGTSFSLTLAHVKVALLEATMGSPVVLATATTNTEAVFWARPME